ncbi:MAG: selenium metabolism-associated LysR family transcriptional regulator [Isosphaeraceae bacterium]
MNDREDRPGQLPHLETFSKAAELASFTATARVMGLTQAAVSQRIQSLERALGLPLFQRRGGRVLPTEAGRTLHDYARRILDLHQEARRMVVGRETPVAGELLLGASSIPGEHLLPALVSRFGRKYPDVRVSASVGDSLAVLRQVERGEVSLGMVGRRTDSPHLEFRHLAADRMRLVVPPGHIWGRRKRKWVSIEQLREQPMILREAGSGLRHCLEKSLDQAGLSSAGLRVVLELGSNEAIKEAVLQGAGVAILSAYAVRKEIQSGLLHALEVRGIRCDRDLYLVQDIRRVLPPPARLFLAFLEAHPIVVPTP